MNNPARAGKPDRRYVYLFLVMAFFAVNTALASPVAASAGGDGWSAQDSGTLSTLWSVDFVDAAHGWAVGDDGTILTTINGGATWSAQDSGIAWYLDGVCFTDAAHGWAVGSAGTILATANGGVTWNQQYSGTTADLNAVAFTDAMHGWAVGDGGTLAATSNGGVTWTASDSGPTTENLNAIAFSADGGAGTIVGDNGTVFIYDASAAGQAPAVARAARTMGMTRRASISSSNLNAATFADASHCWVTGDSGTIFVNSSASSPTSPWNAQSSGVTANLNGVAFPDASHGWAVGDGWYNWSGTILATVNGGATWRDQSAAITAPLNAVAFVDSTHGWAVGHSGAIFATASGGVATPTVSLKLSGLKNGTLKLGKRVTAKGIVAPTSLAGSKVTLTVQVKKGRKWIKAKVAATVIGSEGAYSWKYKPRKKSTCRVRAAIARTAANSPAKTPWRAFKVK